LLLCYSSLMEFEVVKLHLKYDPVEELSIRRIYLKQQVGISI